MLETEVAAMCWKQTTLLSTSRYTTAQDSRRCVVWGNAEKEEAFSLSGYDQYRFISAEASYVPPGRRLLTRISGFSGRALNSPQTSSQFICIDQIVDVVCISVIHYVRIVYIGSIIGHHARKLALIVINKVFTTFRWGHVRAGQFLALRQTLSAPWSRWL